jgi:alpha-beta hydrolase superfamily lysophospholipase
LFGLFHRKKNLETPPQKILIAFHGFGEHGGRYLHFPHYLKNTIDAFFTLDHRGHGKSDGVRGDAESFDRLVDDMASTVERMQERFPKSKIHVLGHSLGGLAVLRLALLYPHLPVISLTVSAPFLGLHHKIPLWKTTAALLLSKAWGTLSLSDRFDPNVLSRDPRVVENFAADRLNHNRMTSRMYADLMRAQRDTLSRTEGIEWPTLFIVPLADELVDSKLTLDYVQSLEKAHSTHSLKLVTIEEDRHEPMNEVDKEVFFKALEEWIQENE